MKVNDVVEIYEGNNAIIGIIKTVSEDGYIIAIGGNKIKFCYKKDLVKIGSLVKITD